MRQHLFAIEDVQLAEGQGWEVPAVCGAWFTPGPRRDPGRVDEVEEDPERRCGRCFELTGLRP